MKTIHQPTPPAQTRNVLTLRGVRREALQPRTATPILSDSEYWYVWAPSRRRPRQRHASLAFAVDEATRLSTLTPGVRFNVYHAVRVGAALK